MFKVFISYSSKDASEARRLARELTRHNVKTWIDEYEILPGDSIKKKISDGIRQSDFLIVIVSKNSLSSDWVRFEIEQAFAKNRAASSGPWRHGKSQPPHGRSCQSPHLVQLLSWSWARTQQSPVSQELERARYFRLHAQAGSFCHGLLWANCLSRNARCL